MKYLARVIPGRGEGRRLGFPTLNLGVPEGFGAEQGVYAGWVWIGSEKMPAAFHHGPVPTFGIVAASLEAHVIDADIPQPPQALEFELVQRLREVQAFTGPETLSRQIAADVAAARAILQAGPEGL